MAKISLTNTYQKYPKYKNSGVEWVGQVPESWDVATSRRLFSTKKKLANETDSQKVLSLTLGGVIPRVLDGSGKNPANYDTYQEFQKDDLVFCLFDYDVTPRTIGYVGENGMMTGAYTRLIPKEETVSRFFYYYFLSLDYTKELLHLCTGLRNSISKPVFWSMKNPLPNKEEQEKIAKFLDEQTARIDKTIAKKQRLIELLKEKRTATINHAVTKGLDPKAELVDSGVEWIGQTPKNWQIFSLKSFGEAIIGLTYSPEDVGDETGTAVLRSSNIKNGHTVMEDVVYVQKSIPKKLVLREDDILICSRNGSKKLIGKNAIIGSDLAGQTFGAFMTVYRSKHNQFVYWFLNSNIFLAQTELFVSSTINQLTINALKNLKIALPDEKTQKKISEYLTAKDAGFREAINKVEKSIAQLQEFKSSLISHAVTGKIKV